MLFLQDFEQNPHLEERWAHSKPKVKSAAIRQPLRPNVPPNHEIRNYVLPSQPAINASSWLSKREIPTSAEIFGKGEGNGDVEPTIAVNKIKGPWMSKEEYLSTHYELLREDATLPLRGAVETVREHPNMRDDDNICIYENTYIVGITFSNKGLACRIQFSLARAGKKINWAQSKRLKQGTMIALTPARDMFKTECKVAVVAARPLPGLEQNPAEIDIFFAAPEEIEIDPQQKWVMIESRVGYFEASRHTLTALQKMMSENMPFSKHLIDAQTSVEPPSYLKKHTVADLSSIFTDSLHGSMDNVDLLHNWPISPQTELDRSQQGALRRILTKELAVVQGPPGTGKTHVSVVALRALLQNRTEDDPPIIITAHTNHALDQLLRHIAGFESDFIRLGGRTLDQDIIKKRTLYELRRSTTMPNVMGGMRGPAHGKLKRSTEAIVRLLGPLLNQKEPFEARVLYEMGLLSEQQFVSLEKGASGWVRPTQQNQPEGSMAIWLGDGLALYHRSFLRDDLPFDFEEVDLEFEQLKEIEAESKGITDDDDIETLKGRYVCFTDRFVGRKSTNVPKSKLEKAFDELDMWKIPESIRGAVYAVLHLRAKEAIRAAVRREAVSYMRAVTEVKIGNWEQDILHLQKCKVIGVTTTGLSKNRALLSSLDPRIVLIEEAAETLEGPVTAACMKSVEHLILVGDHQQLRGHCNIQQLEDEPYNLAVSMFERLVDNKLDFSTLTRQRRMIPEIRSMLAPIYTSYHDHPSVLEQAPVEGMGGFNSYFFSHNWYESKDKLMSTYNQKEADMIVGFFNYLLLNGVKAKSITILTFYNGQRKLILKDLRNHPGLEGNYFNVVTVDSYQGEENDVVLLSLVRSNPGGNIGFLKIKNRVCVALSRAKRGFYIFGNGQRLCEADDSGLWFHVVKIMASNEPRRIGYALPLECQKHRRRIWMQNPLDWSDISYGGCKLPCNEQRDCGHMCELTCHPFSHDLIECQYACEKKLSCGHRCLKMCSENPCRCACTEAHSIPTVSKEWSVRELQEGTDLLDLSLSESPPQPDQVQGTAWTSNSTSPERRTLATQAWSEYANGGMVEADARMDAEAVKAAADERAKMLDKGNGDALIQVPPEDNTVPKLIDFGDDSGPELVNTAGHVLVRKLSDGKGGFRGKWKSRFTPGAGENMGVGLGVASSNRPAKTQTQIQAQEISLLD